MAALFFLALIVLVAVLAPVYGADSTDATAEGVRDERGWWPAGPTAVPRPRF